MFLLDLVHGVVEYLGVFLQLVEVEDAVLGDSGAEELSGGRLLLDGDLRVLALRELPEYVFVVLFFVGCGCRWVCSAGGGVLGYLQEVICVDDVDCGGGVSGGVAGHSFESSFSELQFLDRHRIT